MRPTNAAACVIEPSLNRARNSECLHHAQPQSLQRSQLSGTAEITHTKTGRAQIQLGGATSPCKSPEEVDMNNSWMPMGFHTITPNVVVDRAEDAVAFLRKAFGFVENYRLTTSNGKIAHCELQLGDSILNIGEAMDGFPSSTLMAQIYVENSDELFQLAVQAGAKILMPMTDMFFGSREGRVEDPFGNVWTIATLHEVVEPAEMQRRMAEAGY